MSLTESEIYSQSESLRSTFNWFMSNRDELGRTFKSSKKKKIVFIGCGSSFMVAKTAKELFAREKGWQAYAIAGGDFIVSPNEYANIVDDSIVVFLTRSGLTSEIHRSAEILKSFDIAKIITITMVKNSKLSSGSELSIVLPWAYDKSVCQTRTVTNFYVSLLLLHAIVTDAEELIAEIDKAIDYQAGFLKQYRQEAVRIVAEGFDNVVVLADGVLSGLAEEGSLAFTEISMISGKYFHLLDYRHGPKVLNDENTLNIVVLRPVGMSYQYAMVEDLLNMGGSMVTLGESDEPRELVASHITIPFSNYSVMGIFLINICQMIALEKALAMGCNPDKPKGLDAYITL